MSKAQRAVRLVILGVAVFVSARFLLGTPEVPPESSFALGLDELRRLAEGPPEWRPTEIQVLEVVPDEKPLLGVTGEWTLASFSMPWTSFRLVYPNQTILIDVPDVRDASPAARAALRGALERANLVLFTHEHPDHLGGLAALFEGMTRPERLRFNAVQLAASGLSLKAPKRFAENGATRIGPGVVMRPAPGHSPGSVIYYVRTRADREYLFVGDIAWHRDHFEGPKVHPRVSGWVIGEDSDAVTQQLRALHAAQIANPIVVVPSHDGAYLKTLVESGALRRGFE